jgi:hypothetical protein
MMIAKVGGPALNDLIDYPKNVKERLSQQSGKILIAGILKSIEYLIEAQEISKIMETIRMPLEVAFAKIVLTQQSASSKSTPPAASINIPEKKTISVPENIVTPIKLKSTVSDSVKVERVSDGEEISLSLIQQQWNSLTHEVSRQKMSLATYLGEACASAYHNGLLTIGFLKEHRFAKESFEIKDNVLLVEKILSEKLGVPIHIAVRIIEQAIAKESQPIVDDAINMFGGKVVKEWHNE